MPSLFRVDGYVVRFWSNDMGEPVHVHVINGNKSVNLRLLRDGSCEVARGTNHGISSKDISTLKTYVKAEYGFICNSWKNIFGYLSFYK